MSDDWEAAADDWEKAAPVLPATKAAAKPASAEYETKGAALLAGEVDMSKFADEEEEEEEPAPAASSAAKKPTSSRAQAKAGASKAAAGPKAGESSEPLDPVAEKLRQQRLVEQSDYAASLELFGDKQTPLSAYLPKSLKDFDDFAWEIVSRHVLPHKDSKHFKAFLKSLFKAALEPLPSTEVKDLEASMATVRIEKGKAEAAEKAKKTTTKKSLNLGKSGGSAGLDDYVYDTAGDGDDYDFM